MDKAGRAITGAVRKMASKDDGVFGPTLKSFISCTISAKSQDPNVREDLYMQKCNYIKKKATDFLIVFFPFYRKLCETCGNLYQE